jgi:hypothetical protein
MTRVISLLYASTTPARQLEILINEGLAKVIVNGEINAIDFVPSPLRGEG